MQVQAAERRAEPRQHLLRDVRDAVDAHGTEHAEEVASALAIVAGHRVGSGEGKCLDPPPSFHLHHHHAKRRLGGEGRQRRQGKAGQGMGKGGREAIGRERCIWQRLAVSTLA